MNVTRTMLWGLLGTTLGAAIAILFLFLFWSGAFQTQYVPEYPTVLRPCADGQDFSPVPIVIDGESTILPCNDPVTVYPKADR